MRTIKLAIVGAGAWSTEMHLPVLVQLQKAGHVRYRAVCDLDERRATRYAAAINAEGVYTDMQVMLSQVCCDGVILLVPPAISPVVIRTAATHSMPFLVEKPPAPNARVHRELIKTVGHLPHVVAYNRRHSPYTLQAVEWIKGMRPQLVCTQFSRHRRREANFAETAVHAIDTTRFLAGSDLKTFRIEIAPSAHAWNFFIHGWFANGARCEIMITPDTGSAEEHYIVRSEDRTVALAFPHRGVHDLPGFVELREKNRVVRHMGPRAFSISPRDIPALSGIRGEHETFVNLLLNRDTPSSTLETTLQTQLIRDRLESKLARISARRR